MTFASAFGCDQPIEMVEHLPRAASYPQGNETTRVCRFGFGSVSVRRFLMRVNRLFASRRRFSISTSELSRTRRRLGPECMVRPADQFIHSIPVATSLMTKFAHPPRLTISEHCPAVRTFGAVSSGARHFPAHFDQSVQRGNQDDLQHGPIFTSRPRNQVSFPKGLLHQASSSIVMYPHGHSFAHRPHPLQ